MEFRSFLASFSPLLEGKSKQLNQAVWLLETTGSPDAADLKAAIDTELKYLFTNPDLYRRLIEWDQDPALSDPVLKRQLNILIRNAKSNQIDKTLVEKIAQKEARLAETYANFRPKLNGKTLTENDIREILKNESDLSLRKKAWEASKEIGQAMAPQILELVHLRNEAARHLGYRDFCEMQLDLQEVDRAALLQMLDNLAQKSDRAYAALMQEIALKLGSRDPWAWGDPFCQEDPLDVKELDELAEGCDLVEAARAFYDKMGFDVRPILARSDLYERPGKNQHAFCMHIDRRGDIRTLNNVKPSIKWLDTLLHELGHGVYEMGLNQDMPWLLLEPPHMIPTEAMALLMGRQAYRPDSLVQLLGPQKRPLLDKANKSLRRRELIFSRWVLVMSAFESELYRDPTQDLNGLWWRLVGKYQMIAAPKGREGKCDWAAKYHIGLAPVYYFSYLLGELFASSIENALPKKGLATPEAGAFLRERLFAPGNRWSWGELVKHVTNKPLTPDDWLKEFA